MSSRSRSHLATGLCDIKRVTITGGQTALPATHLTSIPCTPILPRGTSDQKTDGTQATTIAFETMVFGDHDIKKGDVLVAGGIEYPIKNAFRYGTAEAFMVLVLEARQANVEADSEFVR